jgi:CO/xanthine dehydrogenase FAD-binding subunit
MPDLRLGKRSPACLVDITRIPGMDRIEWSGDTVTVGAAVTFAALRDSPIIQPRVPALAEAARSVGAAPIQAVATWVGNIVQAMPAADGAIMALALEAEAHLVDSRDTAPHEAEGWRPVESLFAGPGRSLVDPTHQLITALRFRLPPGAWGTAWARVGRRESLVLPVLNCAVRLCLQPDGAHIAGVTLALGPVAPRPYRARRTEEFLIGRPPEAEVFRQAAAIARQESDPRSSPVRASRDYRLAIIPPLVTAALNIAARRARDSVTGACS